MEFRAITFFPDNGGSLGGRGMERFCCSEKKGVDFYHMIPAHLCHRNAQHWQVTFPYKHTQTNPFTALLSHSAAAKWCLLHSLVKTAKTFHCFYNKLIMLVIWVQKLRLHVLLFFIFFLIGSFLVKTLVLCNKNVYLFCI